MRAVFIRHGQSTGNIGIPWEDVSLPHLTEEGWRQARAVAEHWTETPDLIVTSPFVRARQTAQPTAERFPQVPLEVWPIEEFTYLQPARWNGTQNIERMPAVEQYWSVCEPEFCDGEGAESFQTLLDRAQVALASLEQMPKGNLVYLFSHGQFMQAVRSLVLDSNLTSTAKMARFWSPGTAANQNGELVPLEWDGSLWRHTAPASTPLAAASR